MSTIVRARSIWSLSIPLLALLSQTPARADVNACVNAHSDGQLARDEGRLLQAVTLFRQCAVTECPGPVQKDCSEFLSAAEARLPSVVLSARDENDNDVLDVSVTLDGEPIADPLSGLAVRIDPGKRHFEFARPNGKSVSVDLIAREGERGRPVIAVFETEREEAVVTSPEHQAAPAPEKEPSTPFVGEPLALVLAGVGAVALGGFTYFALDGKSQQSELEGTCAPDCSPTAVDKVESTYLLADVSLVASALAFSGAAYFYFTAVPTSGPETGAAGWSITAGGRF